MDTGQAPTRAAILELRAERNVAAEAYDFLDEKRLLLAAQMLQQLRRYEALRDALEKKMQEARQNLLAGVQRHGLQGLSVYPASPLEGVRIETRTRNVMGVTLLETALHVPQTPPAPAPASNPSIEAVQVGVVFREVLALSAELAGISGNLYRLFATYRLTERRARALENIFLPDLERALQRMSGYLEELDLEDAIRARWLRRSR
jgi:V/A-type H+-transporting ATPase subunit D